MARELNHGDRSDEWTPTGLTPPARIGAWVRLVRPKQWVKNLLVAAAPFAAGTLFNIDVLVQVALGFAAFSLASSGIYAINDARDVPGDREHPRKRHRPVAAGVISPRDATRGGIVLIVAGIGFAVLTTAPLFVAVLVTYLATASAYTYWWKHYPLADVLVIAFGFLLRALAGGALVDVRISEWFVIVATFAALFVSAGKRFGEMRQLGENGAAHRPSLDGYPPGFVEFILAVSAGVTMVGYSLWAFEIGGTGGIPWLAVSIGPMVVGVLRYAQLVYRGEGGAPETLLFRDRPLQAIGLLWIIVLMLGFYA